MTEKVKAGAIGTLVGVIADLAMYGGDVLVSTLFFVMQDAGAIVSFLAYLSTYAARVAWLPEGMVEQAYEVVLALVLLLLAYRLVRAWIGRVTS